MLENRILSQSRGRSRLLYLDKGKVKVIEKGVSCGASGFTFSADSSDLDDVSSIREERQVQG